MSYTGLYKFKKNGDSELFNKIQNSFRGAIAIWNILDQKYLKGYIPEYAKFLTKKQEIYYRSSDPKAISIKEVWQLVDSKEITEVDRICLLSTFDDVIVYKKDIAKLLDAFVKFEGETSLKEQAKVIENELKRDPDLIAIAWNQTSVNAAWYSEKSNEEEICPYNIFESNIHWDMFNEQKNVKMKPKYLVRPDDYHIFELDESNGCYRSWTLRSIKGINGKRATAKSDYTFENLTKKYNFLPITESELNEYEIKHDKNSDMRIGSVNTDEITKGDTITKKVTYKIKIIDIKGSLPDKYRNNFVEWLECKSIELGLGKHNEYYYDHDQTGKKHIEVSFDVSI